MAALETGANLRSPQVGANPGSANTDPIVRTIATIEAESARIQAGDPGAVDAVFASQALALDTLFTQTAHDRRSRTVGSRRDTLALALKAQLQSRATLKCLVSPMTPPREGRAHAQPAPASVESTTAQKRNPSEQTIGGENS